MYGLKPVPFKFARRRAKPSLVESDAARLKSCPDTKHEGGLEKKREIPVRSTVNLPQASELPRRPGIAAYFTPRSRKILLTIAALWMLLYGSFTLLRPPLLDDADSVHAEVAREMVVGQDWITLHANGIRYLEKAPLFIGAWLPVSCFCPEDWAARLPLAIYTLGLFITVYLGGPRFFNSSSPGSMRR